MVDTVPQPLIDLLLFIHSTCVFPSSFYHTDQPYTFFDDSFERRVLIYLLTTDTNSERDHLTINHHKIVGEMT